MRRDGSPREYPFKSRPEAAVQVLEACLALRRRYWPRSEGILGAQLNLAACLPKLGRSDEALVLEREVYARRMAVLGVSHASTLMTGYNLAVSLDNLRRPEESKTLLQDHLLPVARTSLGADHYVTLAINQSLAAALVNDPEGTRDDLRLNQHGTASTRPLITTQATTYSKPRLSCKTWSRGDGGSSGPRIQTRAYAKPYYPKCAREYIENSRGLKP